MIDGTKCPKCGKEFFPYPDHVYRVGSKRYCSWTCFRTRDEANIEKKCKYNGRKATAVEQYTLDGKYVREFEGARKAAEFMGCSTVTIANACRKNGRAVKFIWKYKK